MTLDPDRISVVAFDVFGTVFDLSGVSGFELRNYVDQIERPEWMPLLLPEPWERLPAHPDAREGINRLRGEYVVVTCSNGPLGLLAMMSKNAGLCWDAIVPLEMNRVYKPDRRAYLTVCEVFDVPPESVLMVTANPKLGRNDFGDVQAARLVGMQSVLIRHEGGPRDIIELAERLGC